MSSTHLFPFLEEKTELLDTMEEIDEEDEEDGEEDEANITDDNLSVLSETDTEPPDKLVSRQMLDKLQEYHVNVA